VPASTPTPIAIQRRSSGEGDDALKVNWCELTVTDPAGKVIYLNGFNHRLQNHRREFAGILSAGRARWKIENENNNTLKTKAIIWNIILATAKSTSPRSWRP